MSAALDTTTQARTHRAISLETIGMTKRFGSLVALEDVSIKVEAGTLHALLGENGAGKSTLVKCIMGFYQPTSGSVLIDGRQHWFVSHLVARRSWWRGRVLAVMNAQWMGTWDVAPRSHPNDGLLDVFDSDLSLGDRWKARQRLRTGTHVPHPGIAQRRVAALQVELGEPLGIWLDGERVGDGRTLSIRVEPDALICVV